MNFKTTFVLLIIFLGIGGYLFFTSRGDRADDDEIRQREELVLGGVTAADVTKVAVSPAQGERKVFERDGQGWRLVEPVAAKAKSWDVDAFVGALTGLKREGRVDEGEADAARAVREKPAYTVELTTKDNQTRKLAVGAKSVVGNTTYAQVDGKGRIYVVSGAVHDQLAKRAAEFRETELVATGPSDVRRIELEPAGGQRVVLEKTDQAWQVTQPTTMPADPQAAESLASTLASLRAVEFAKEDKPLGTTRLTVSVTPAKPDASPTVVRFGQWDDILQKNVLARVGDGPVAKVGVATFEQVNKSLLDLRSKDVLTVDPAKVRAVSIARTLSATTQPTTRPADEGTVTVRKVVPDVTMGPAAPTTQAVATTQETATTRDTAATQPATPPAEAEASWIYEGREGTVDEAQVQSLLASFNPLRATKFLPSPPTEGVTGRYTVRIDSGEGNSQQLELIETNGSAVVATHQDVTFDVSPVLIETVKRLSGVPVTPAPAAAEPELPMMPPMGQ